MTEAKMDGGSIGDRFPTNEQMLAMVDSGNPIRMTVPGDPRVIFFVEADGSRIGLELPPGDLPSDVRPYRAIEISGGGTEHSMRVSSTRRSLYPEFMRLLAGIAERVQVSKHPPGSAIREALEAWREILQRDRALALERELGLLGELWAVWRLVAGGLDPADAVAAWRGSESEEHDIGLVGDDVEVKTTMSERRIHTISGLTQLVPTGSRPLWVLSIQFTSAGDGGQTLAEYVDLVRGGLGTSAAGTVAAFDRKVAAVIGDHEEDSDRAWRLRSSPRLIPVDHSFPRLTPAVLAGIPEVSRRNIEEVWYRVSVDGMGHPDGMGPFNLVMGASDRGESPWI